MGLWGLGDRRVPGKDRRREALSVTHLFFGGMPTPCLEWQLRLLIITGAPSLPGSARAGGRGAGRAPAEPTMGIPGKSTGVNISPTVTSTWRL